MSVFTAKNDTYCIYDVAMECLDIIPTKKTLIDVDGEDHDYFDSKLNNDKFIKQLVEQLTAPISPESFIQ